MNTIKSFIERNGTSIARLCAVLGLIFLLVTGIQNSFDVQLVPKAGVASLVFFLAGLVLGLAHTYLFTDKAERKAKELEKWQALRSSGRRRYVIVHGILLWAYPVSLFVAFVDWSPFEIAYRHDSVGETVFFFFSWTLIGIVFGFLNWHLNERRMGPVANPTPTQTVEAT